jgi:hypothetical protein
MAIYKVTSMEQTIQYDAEMTPQEAYKITFTVGEHGPFTVSIPVKDYSATLGRQVLEAKAFEIAQTLGI